MSEGADDDFAPGVAVPHVLDGRRCLAQRVGPVDDWPDLAGLDEAGERKEVRRVLRAEAGHSTIVAPAVVVTSAVPDFAAACAGSLRLVLAVVGRHLDRAIGPGYVARRLA